MGSNGGDLRRLWFSTQSTREGVGKRWRQAVDVYTGVGEKHRRAIELRNHPIPEAELVDWREGKPGHRDKRVVPCSGGVREPGMCGHSPRGNRETSGRNLRGTEIATAEATGKVSSSTPVVISSEESDGNIVPGKSVNNGVTTPAESMEGRTPRIEYDGAVYHVMSRGNRCEKIYSDDSAVNLSLKPLCVPR